MSRENMFTATEREDWVTPEIEEAFMKAAKGGELACSQAMEFARSNKIPLHKMKYLSDLFKIRIISCQLGTF
jgi:hypothetical protein